MTDEHVTLSAVPPRCGGTKKDGSPCGMLGASPTPDGLRCRHHGAPPAPGASRKPRVPRPPVDALRTVADALALSSWASLMAARGRLSNGQVAAVLGACKEWRQCLRDSGIVAEFDRLKEIVARLSATKVGP